MVAALLGMLLDPARFEPVYPQPGERPEEALARVRPPVTILLDAELEAARSDLFLTRAQRSRATVLLFTPPLGAPVEATLTARAAERGLSCFALPVDRAALTRILDEAVSGPAGTALGLASLCVAGLALHLGAALLA